MRSYRSYEAKRMQSQGDSSIRRAVNDASALLGRPTMARVWILTITRVLVGLLDLTGVFLLSAFTTTALEQEGSGVVPWLSSWTISPILTLVLALLALSVKSMSSLALSVSLSSVLNRRCTEVIRSSTSFLDDGGFEKINGEDSHRLHYQLTAGLRAGTTGIVGPLSTLVSESSLIVLFVVFLISTNLAAALLSILILGTATRTLHKSLSLRQYRLGQLAGSASIRSLSTFQELIHGYKELYVRGSVKSMVQRFTANEETMSLLQIKQSLYGSIPRHTLESVVMMSLGVIAGAALVVGDLESAILLITIFGAATARILPSLIPLQASLSELQSNLGKSHEFREFLQKTQRADHETPFLVSKDTPSGDGPDIYFEGVSYRYPDASDDAIQDVNLHLGGDEWVAIDGPSGSGKSTFLEVLLGLRRPQSGIVRINGYEPRLFVRHNPGYCAYLPQRIAVINASLAENIAFGVPPAEIDSDRVVRLLQIVGLGSIVERSELGLSQQIGEMGAGLSGGQLQRLGIARCLYTSPRILLLDESTSGLDPVTQEEILNVIKALSNEILIISISHDSRVVAFATKRLSIEKGRLKNVNS